jgi:membrane associated rhomboid family serine protease
LIPEEAVHDTDPRPHPDQPLSARHRPACPRQYRGLRPADARAGGGGERALQQVILDYGVIPAQVSAAPLSAATWLDFLTSMFMHGGVMHILGNMLYLWIFGNNIEDVMGKFWFTRLLPRLRRGGKPCAGLVIARLPHPRHRRQRRNRRRAGGLPRLLPTARVDTLIIFGFLRVITSLPAIIVLGMWFVLQLFNGFLSFGVSQASQGGVAWFAHIGGFVAGLILCLPWIAKARRSGAHLVRYW